MSAANDFYLFPNEDRNEWIEKYNKLVADIKQGKIVFDESSKSISDLKIGSHNINCLGKHHIIPKSIRPDLEKDKRNIVELPFREHMDLHYYLWKADKTYARQLWFGCVFGRKHKLWDLPGKDEEYEKLKKDLRQKRKKC